MAQEAEISRRAKRLTNRTYSAQFKAELVAACQVPGASIAALAGQTGMNANVLHRWLKEYQREGRHKLKPAQSSANSLPVPAFMPLSPSSAPPRPVANKSQIAEFALDRFSKIYDIEREVKALTAIERQEIRQHKTNPILDALHEWMSLQCQKVPAGSATAKALGRAHPLCGRRAIARGQQLN